MKNSKINCRATINRFILLSLTLCYIFTAYCSNKEQEIKQFLIYDAMSYIGKPDLSHYGLQPVYLMYEVTLTKKDNGNQIWQIPSTSLGKLRLHNSNMHVNMGSWAINTMNSPQEPEKFTDAIIINAPIVDNDTITWKKELYITIKEAQFKSEGKPIYVYLPTTSLNNNYTIKATEWKTALKTTHQWCNGIIIHDINNNLPDTNTAIWQETLKFIREMKNTVD